MDSVAVKSCKQSMQLQPADAEDKTWPDAAAGQLLPGKAGAEKAGRPSCQATHSGGSPQKPAQPTRKQAGQATACRVPPKNPHFAHQLEPLAPGLSTWAALSLAACPFATAQLNPPPTEQQARGHHFAAAPSSQARTPPRLAIARFPRATFPREHPSPGPHCPT